MDKSELAKGVKNNLQFTRAEREYFERECGFTDEELEVFRLRSRGKTILEISFIMEENHSKDSPNGYSVSRVEAKIRNIKKKILKVL